MLTSSGCVKDKDCPKGCSHVCKNPPEGYVEDNETILRMLNTPLHINTNTGEVHSAAFPSSQLLGSGCSVDRKVKTSAKNYVQLMSLLDERQRRRGGALAAIAVGTAQKVRAVGTPERLFFFCPSSKKSRPSHADIFLVRKPAKNYWNMIRHKLKKGFHIVLISGFKETSQRLFQ